MTKYLYMFKASGLQRYIFATQPLREAIGASQLIIELTENYLDDALMQTGADESCKTIQRAAGSAILEFDDEKALRRFYALWPLLVSQIAPGLEIDQWAAKRSDNLFDDLEDGWEALRARRNTSPPPIPEVAPVVRRSEDSGQAVVAPNPTPRGGVVDAASLRKLEIAERHEGSAAGVKPGEGLRGMDRFRLGYRPRPNRPWRGLLPRRRPRRRKSHRRLSHRGRKFHFGVRAQR